MVVDWRQRMFEAATAEVDKFVDCQPDFALDAEQPSRVDVQRNGGGTNFVLWAATGMSMLSLSTTTQNGEPPDGATREPACSISLPLDWFHVCMLLSLRP